MWEGLQKQVRWSRSDSGGSKGKILWTRAQGIRSWPVPEENIFIKSEELNLWSKLIPILCNKRERNYCVSGIGRCLLDPAFTQRQNEQCHMKKHQESHACKKALCLWQGRQRPLDYDSPQAPLLLAGLGKYNSFNDVFLKKHLTHPKYIPKGENGKKIYWSEYTYYHGSVKNGWPNTLPRIQAS